MKISPPSRSLSKTTLIVTPLFIIILSVLLTTYDVSYLFILQFTQNLASDSDINIIPSMKIINNTGAYGDSLIADSVKSEFNKYANTSDLPMASKINAPLIDLSTVENWFSKHSIVKGFSPRWIVPVLSGKIKLDSLLLLMDVKKEKEVGIGQRAGLKTLRKSQVAVSDELLSSLKLKTGDTLSFSIQIKNIFESGQLLTKFQSDESSEQYIPESNQTNIDNFVKTLQDYINTQQLNFTITQNEVDIIKRLYNTSYDYRFEIVQSVKPLGCWASSLHNVMVADLINIEIIIQKILQNLIDEVNKSYNPFSTFIPSNFISLLPNSALLLPYVNKFAYGYAPIVSVRLSERSQFYKPHETLLHKRYYLMLYDTPSQISVLPMEPLYQMTLGIKYFFDSIIQIFTLISILLYINVMRIILKDVYDEKQIEIGVWRTLGIGGVKINHTKIHKDNALESVLNTVANKFNFSAQNQDHQQKEQGLTDKLSFTDNLKYNWQMLNKIGHFPYWAITCAVSTLLYFLLKLLFISVIAEKLGYQAFKLNYFEPFVLFIILLLYTQLSCILHILAIFKNSIVQSMKPFKRTFDIVKVRVIKMATFGLSFEMLLVAFMLIYYGMVSYYFIPRAILYDQQQLQTILFNSLFFIMILGAITLLTVVQSYFQLMLLNVCFLLSKRMKNMKTVVIKNLKAKKFTNLNISLSLALIFAFVLFFTSGIKLQITLIQSFINRAQGADLNYYNNQKNSFNQTYAKINKYLDQNHDGLEYAWMSKPLSREGISLQFVDYRRLNKPVRTDFRVLSYNYLDASYSQYYVPESFLDSYTYTKLPNGIYNGFDSIYSARESIGQYRQNQTITSIDPFDVISVGKATFYDEYPQFSPLPKQEQIINIAISDSLKKKLGANVGYVYKIVVSNDRQGRRKYSRAKITHILKALPGLDMLGNKVFISEQQAKYLYSQIEVDEQFLKYEKLVINGRTQSLKKVSANILAMSPPHTSMTEIDFVASSFAVLENYLQTYISLLSVIMNTLSVLLLFLYTRNKCSEETQLYKILRAVGVHTLDLRIMVFMEVLIRVFVSILIGILFGTFFSVIFAHQVETLLMIQTPSLDLTIVLIMASILLVVFSITVILSTKKLEEKTVSQMTRH